ncbi:MAG: hypothetical protein ACRYFX_19790 [Janthinobacterium lividum]
MLTRIEDSSEYFTTSRFPTERVRVRLFGVTVYRSEQAVDGGPRHVWVLGVLVYQAVRQR